MANEQIIYVGPEEELTNVRERLEHTQAGRITLVIPQQTQLRSHVGWRLLRSRVRELGQDVLVISSDRQIRAVAKAAGFRVAESLESPPSDRPRPNSRPVRSDAGSKASQSSGKQVASGRPDSRSLQPGKQPSKRNLPADGRQQTPLSSSSKGGAFSGSGEMNTGTGASASSTFDIEDLSFDSRYPLPNQAVPPGHSVAAGREDDEIDPLVADYYVARSIRKAAQGADAGATPSASEMTGPSGSTPEQSSKIPPQSELDDDPFAYMEDIQPVALPEQRASTFIHDIDQGIPDLSDIPTDVHEIEIEDLGDEGEVMLQHDSSLHALAEPMHEEQGMQETPRIYGMPPRSSRMGSNSRPSFENFEDEDELLPVPIPDQPTRSTPSYPARSSGVPAPLVAGRREPQPIIQPPPQARNVSTKSSAQQTRKPASTKTSRTVTKPPMSGKTGALSNHQARRIAIITGISLAVLVCAVLAFLFFGSNATVTIIVPSQPLSVTGHYMASTNRHDTQQNTIPSQVLMYSASATGQGTATGTVKQGNQVATGTVTFSNKGTTALDIPIKTVLSTSGAVAIQFVTTADALVQPDSSSAPPSVVPVQAKDPGDSGNVAANSINIIPPESLNSIATSNQIPLTSVNLTATNPSPMVGGGATNVPAVSSTDVNTLAQALQKQVQNEINIWLSKSVLKGDVTGTLMPNVLGSSTPLPEEKMITTPTVGQPAPGGKFTGVLSVTVSVLVIRNAAIQAAGRTQLNADAQHKNPPFVLATQLPVTVKVTSSTPSKDGTTLSITVDATGHIVPQVSTQGISNLVAGKSQDQAKSSITIFISKQTGIKEGVSTSIDIFPPFLGTMPFRPEQIHIIVQPGPATGSPNG
jgi:hypothetical protein